MNIKDFPMYEEKIKAAEGSAKAELISYYTGPATGLVWNKDAQKLEIAATHADLADGTVIDLSEYTGPGTGKVYDKETKTLKVAAGYLELADGSVVRAADVTGPGTGKVYDPVTKTLVDAK